MENDSPPASPRQTQQTKGGEALQSVKKPVKRMHKKNHRAPRENNLKTDPISKEKTFVMYTPTDMSA
jgi:hypothetical protein